MYPCNSHRIPPTLNTEYGRYFKDLPEKYGMRYAHVSLSADPENSQIMGQHEGFDLVCVAYFPTSTAFLASWSDGDVRRGFTTHRQSMVNSGFKHYWIRTTREGGGIIR